MEPNLSTPTGQANASAPSTTGQQTITPTSGSNTLTPQIFKQQVMAAHPEYEKAIASDGTPYATMDATDFTQRFAQKYPDAVTKAGNHYTDYLPSQAQTDAAQPSKPGVIQSMIQTAANPFLQAIRVPAGLAQLIVGKLTGSQEDTQNAQKLLSNQPMDFGAFGTVNQAGFDQNGNKLGLGGATEQAVGAGLQAAPYALGVGEVADAAETAGSQTIGSLAKAGAATGAVAGGSAGVGQALQQGAETDEDAGGTLGNALIQGGEGTIAGGALGGLIGGASGVVGKVAGAIGKDVPTDNAVASLDPELTGKKLVNAYKSGTTKGLVNPSGLFSPQGLSTDPQITSLAKNLSDIKFSGGTNPAQDLVNLGKAMTETEAKITPYNDTGVETGVKRVLANELENLKTTAPREFSGIKESQSAYENVINYAKEQIGNYRDTIGGYRDGRINFDTQAKLEFPSAYQDNGTINLKTPAGQAIKATRDLLNKNLYDLAPKASNLQDLIGREADIFKARDLIAPKAAKMNGLTGMGKFIKANPGLVSVGKLAAETLGVGGIAGLVGSHLVPSGQ